MLACSLLAYGFLFYVQMFQESEAAMEELPQHLVAVIEPAASPDVSLLKHLISLLVQLLPAS
ncbi:MAG: hypothetical protein DA408_06610 [Bacteroidetes bacterium]|nr:MAG: hypothetical protein C7N36_12805 [Bacteroidota bacterium]PTM13512.1 MAG: hypothetical protein DA408_06610 [Bacteroidota bacterium]